MLEAQSYGAFALLYASVSVWYRNHYQVALVRLYNGRFLRVFVLIFACQSDNDLIQFSGIRVVVLDPVLVTYRCAGIDAHIKGLGQRES